MNVKSASTTACAVNFRHMVGNVCTDRTGLHIHIASLAGHDLAWPAAPHIATSSSRQGIPAIAHQLFAPMAFASPPFPIARSVSR